jgi:hypothetical protein
MVEGIYKDPPLTRVPSSALRAVLYAEGWSIPLLLRG